MLSLPYLLFAVYVDIIKVLDDKKKIYIGCDHMGPGHSKSRKVQIKKWPGKVRNFLMQSRSATPVVWMPGASGLGTPP